MLYLFDFIIFTILLYCLFGMYLIIRSFFYEKKHKIINTKLIRLTIFFVLFTTFSIIFYGSFIEPKQIITKTINFDSNKIELDKPIKIIFLTDTHFGIYKNTSFAKKISDIVKRENPDLILLGGDYILQKAEYIKLFEPISKLTSQIPTFAVMGNHEYNIGWYNDKNYLDKTPLIKKYFDDWNIHYLINENTQIKLDNQNLDIIGIDDLYTNNADLETASQNLDNQIFNILLSHNPDIILENDKLENIDLILSGHTHGGQIRLPFIGSVANMPTLLEKKYDKGLFKIKNTYLYISAGLGESGPRARLFDPPEISIINLY